MGSGVVNLLYCPRPLVHSHLHTFCQSVKSSQLCIQQSILIFEDRRGAIKKFSAWPSSVYNKIKIVFASYSSKAQNMTCTIWLLGYKYFVHFSSRRLLAFDVEKKGVMQCNEMTILTDSFVPLHALLFWLRIKVVDACFILNNELWNKFLLGYIGIIREVLQKLVCRSGVSILDTHLTDTMFIRKNAHNIYSPKVILCMSCSKPCYYKKQVIF